MSLTIDDLTAIYPDQLVLEFTTQEQEKAWQKIQSKNYINITARWNTFLNYLCLHTLLNYLETEQNFNLSPKVWKQADLLNFWQILSGTALELNQKRIIIIPHEENNCSEFRVPREWVDIPDWIGNYYLAVEINLDQCWLRIWGYTTYEQLRQQGKYNWVDETYYLPAEELMEELTALWLIVESDLNYQRQLNSLPCGELIDRGTPVTAEVGPRGIFNPQTPVPSSRGTRPTDWLGNADLRTVVLRRCNGDSKTSLKFFPPSLSVNDAKTLLSRLARSDRGWLRLNLPFEEWSALIADDRWRRKLYQQHKLMETPQLSKSTINLSEWLQGKFTLGWQPLTEFIDSAIDANVYALRSTSESLSSQVEGVKLLDLGMQLGNQSVALLIGMTPETENKVGVRVQLHPAGEKNYLPTNIKLALINQSGKILQEFAARSQDELIQLKHFTCPRKKRFLIRVALNSYSITEEFALD